MGSRRHRKPMKVKIDLTSGNILKKLLIVAVPMLLTSIVQMAYNLTDMFWVSRVAMIGQNPTEAVAAIGTAGFFPWFGFGLIAIAKIGTSIMVSQAAGRNDKHAVDVIASNGVILMMFLALLYSFYGIFLGGQFFGIFNIENAVVVEEGVRYMRIIAFFGTAYFLVNAFNGVYDGLGKTIKTFYVTGSGLVLNMILDPLFILQFGWGVSGAAFATGISQTTVLLIYLIIYTRKHPPATLRLKAVSMHHIKRLFSLGLPVGFQSMIMTSIAIAIGVMVAQFGESVMTVSRIGSQIEALSWMVASGFQVALASFVGQNVGANQFGRVKAGYKQSMALLIPYGLAVNALLFFGARSLFAIFIDTEPTLSQGIDYLRILSISQLFMILEMVTAGAFNGLGKTRIPSLVQVVGNVMRIPLAIVLMDALTPDKHGIWWALTISSVFKGVVLVALFIGLLVYVGKRLHHTSVEKYGAV